ncbi:MAG: hypothetical protein H0V82_13015 [Candidatus Protochlamydia sp.]|nr:hypothetical protein [Candidatus Protochlamydia sp.]
MIPSQSINRKINENINNESFIRVDIPINDLECPISLKMMKNPVTIIQCGHIFDEKHLKRWYQKISNCPICRSNNIEYKTNFFLKKILTDIKEKTVFADDVNILDEKQAIHSEMQLTDKKTNEIKIDAKLLKSAQIIKNLYNFISWEEDLRLEEPIQLVSSLYNAEEAKKIISKINSIWQNDEAIFIVKARKSDQFRIVVLLVEFHESICKANQKFLNENLNFTIDVWNKLCDNEIGPSKQWQIDHQLIKLAVPPLSYHPEIHNMISDGYLNENYFLDTQGKKLDAFLNCHFFKDNLKYYECTERGFYFFEIGSIEDLFNYALMHAEKKGVVTEAPKYLSS